MPDHVRRAVEEIVGGGPVVSAASQPGGFSPGTADRLLVADGRRAFVKAASPAQNSQVCDIHRTESQVVAALPANPHLPRLLGVVDDSEWIAVVYADIEGRPPLDPWSAVEVDATASALRAIADRCTPSPVPGLRPLPIAFAAEYGGWSRLRDRPSPDLDLWAREHLDVLCELAAHGLASLVGESLVHGDVRADNLIVGSDGRVAVIDWPWASVGAAWFDLLCLAINVDFVGGADPEDLVARYLGDVDPDSLTGALAGLCGFFLDAARDPAPQGLPTLRGFQRAQGESTLRWLRRRLAR